MKCPFCNSEHVEVPTVDIGVGEQQCWPATWNRPRGPLEVVTREDLPNFGIIYRKYRRTDDGSYQEVWEFNKGTIASSLAAELETAIPQEEFIRLVNE